MLKPTIAIDFDGTLCVNKFPEIGEPKIAVINAIKNRKRRGYDLILWTCREGQLLNEALDWCRQFGLEFDAVNDSTESWKEHFNSNPRKVGATEYWDDKAIPLYEIEDEEILKNDPRFRFPIGSNVYISDLKYTCNAYIDWFEDHPKYKSCFKIGQKPVSGDKVFYKILDRIEDVGGPIYLLKPVNHVEPYVYLVYEAGLIATI